MTYIKAGMSRVRLNRPRAQCPAGTHSGTAVHTTLRLLALLIVLWLPLQGYAVAPDMRCPPSMHAVTGAETSVVADDDQVHGSQLSCEAGERSSVTAADEASTTGPGHVACSYCTACMGAMLVSTSSLSSPRALLVEVDLLVPSHLPHIADAPQRPPQAALS